MANGLSVRHSPQIAEGYCLPACAQMALAYLGMPRTQQEIGVTLMIRKGFGIPASQVIRLQTRDIAVHYQSDGTLAALQKWLEAQAPLIAFIQAGELPHWRGTHFQHAVLITGMDAETILMHDPALADGPTGVPIDDFLLAWEAMDNRFAVIAARSRG